MCLFLLVSTKSTFNIRQVLPFVCFLHAAVHRAISKQQSTTSSVSKHRYSVYSQRSTISGGSRMSMAPPYIDDDLYMIIPSSNPRQGNNNSDLVSGPIRVSNSPRESIQGQQYIYYAIENYHPDQEGYISLTAGEAVEVLDKSDDKEWFITTVATDERPSEEGLVPSKVLSAEYIPVRYDSFQEDSYSGSDEGGPQQQQSPPPPLPPDHPSQDEQATVETAKKVASVLPHGDDTAQPQREEDEASLPQQSTSTSKNIMSVTLEESQSCEDTNSEHSDTTPIVSPRGSVHSESLGSGMSSPPIIEKRDQLFINRDQLNPLITQSLTAVELNNASKRRGIISRLPRYGSDPALQESIPLSDSSPAYSIPNLASVGLGKSPMHERVSSILRESVMASTRNRHRSTNDYLPKAGLLDHKRRTHKSSPVVAELKRTLSRSSSQLSEETGSDSKSEDGHHGRSLLTPEAALGEMKKLQMESVEVCACMRACVSVSVFLCACVEYACIFLNT